MRASLTKDLCCQRNQNTVFTFSDSSKKYINNKIAAIFKKVGFFFFYEFVPYSSDQGGYAEGDSKGRLASRVGQKGAARPVGCPFGPFNAALCFNLLFSFSKYRRLKRFTGFYTGNKILDSIMEQVFLRQMFLFWSSLWQSSIA